MAEVAKFDAALKLEKGLQYRRRCTSGRKATSIEGVTALDNNTTEGYAWLLLGLKEWIPGRRRLVLLGLKE